MIHAACLQISSKKKSFIIEGGSTAYFPSFYENNKKNHFCKIIVGLKFSTAFDIRKKMIRRIEAALKEGILEEVKEGMTKYKDSLIMNDAHFVVPLVKYLKEEISLDRAKEEIVDRCLEYVERQMALFNQYKEYLEYEYYENLMVSKIMATNTSGYKDLLIKKL